MNDWNKFLMVARVEAKVGLRGGLFWMFLLLIFGVIGFFHLSFQSNLSLLRAMRFDLPCSFPLVNSILFNLLQFCFIVFAVLQYFSRERSLDTLETLRVKPVSGTCYTLGKAVGIAFPFFCLNLFSLVVAAFIHLAWSDSPFHSWIYLFYLFTFTFPLLVFVLGFSMGLHGVLRSRVVVLQVLLVLGGLGFVYLDSFPYLDPFARFLPNVFSDAVGFTGGALYGFQRGAFLLIGVGLLLVSVLFSGRLADHREFPRGVAIVGFCLCVVGIGLGYLNFARSAEEKEVRSAYQATALKYEPARGLSIREHDIIFQQQGSRLGLASRIVVENQDSLPVERLNFYLNPGLQVSSLREAGKELVAHRENQVVEVKRSLVPGERVELTWSYEGEIDERVCYLEVPYEQLDVVEEIKGWYSWYEDLGVQGTPGRRFCFSEEDFTLLLPECMWYPTLYPPVDVRSSYETRNDFSLYTLKVVKGGEGRVISQGVASTVDDTVVFQNREVLPGITLCRGHYEEVNNGLQVPLFSLSTFEGHYLDPVFHSFVKEIFTPAFFDELSSKTRMSNYGYDRLYMVELPASFTTYYRYWKESELVQPEMLFQREGMDSRGIRRGTDMTVQSVAYDPQPHVGRFATKQRIFKKNASIGLFYRMACSPSEYTVWPVALQQTIWRLYGKWRRATGGGDDTREFEAKKYLDGGSLQQALRDRQLSEEIREKVVEMKGEELLAYLVVNSSGRQVADLADTLLQIREPNMDTRQLLQLIFDYTGVTLEKWLPLWYTTTRLPDFQVADIRWFRDNEGKDFFSGKIRNRGEVRGCVGIQGNYYSLDPGECKEITVGVKYGSVTINVGMAKNVPGVFQFSCSPADRKKVESCILGEKRVDSSAFMTSKNTIIVDNTSPGFRFEGGREPLLQRLLRDERQGGDRAYSPSWKRLIHGTCYGNSLHDAFYKMAGEGNCKAIWEAEIEKGGMYEVFFYDGAVELGRQTHVLKSAHEYCYVVKDREGTHEITSVCQGGSGWISLGRFHFESGKASVVLTDKGKKREVMKPWQQEVDRFFNFNKNLRMMYVITEIIVADAVKWVKVEDK